MSDTTKQGVIGGGCGGPSSETENGYDAGLAAKTQVPRGFFSFRLSSSSLPRNCVLRVCFSRGLQGGNKHPFFINLKKQIFQQFFVKKRYKYFLTSRNHASQAKFYQDFLGSFFSVTPSTYSLSTEWCGRLTSPSTPRNRVNGVVICGLNTKRLKFSNTNNSERTVYYKKAANIKSKSQYCLKTNVNSHSKTKANSYISVHSKSKTESHSKFKVICHSKTKSRSVKSLFYYVILINFKDCLSKINFHFTVKAIFIDSLSFHNSCLFFKAASSHTPGKFSFKYIPPQIPASIVDPKQKAKFLEEHRRQWEKDLRERQKRKRDEEKRKSDELKKPKIGDEMSTAMKLKLQQEKKEKEDAEEKLRKQAEKELREAALKLQQEEAKKKQEEKEKKEKEDRLKQQAMTDAMLKAARDAADKNAAGDAADKNADTDDDSIDSDEVDSEYERELENRRERQGLQKRLKKGYAQACKESITLKVRNSQKGVILATKDYETLEAGVTEILDKAFDDKKDVGITGYGMDDGCVWYSVKNKLTQELLEAEIPKIKTPTDGYTYLVGEDENKPKLYSCFVKDYLWAERSVLEGRIKRYTPDIDFNVTEDDGTVRPTHVKIKVGGVDKVNEIKGQGFVVKLELEARLIKILVEQAERGMEGRIRFGAASSSELQGHGIENLAKKRQEEIEEEERKRKERRERIRQKRKEKFLARHQIHPKP